MTGVRCGLSGLRVEDHVLLGNEAESVDDDLASHRLDGIDNDCHCLFVQLLVRPLRVDVDYF